MKIQIRSIFGSWRTVSKEHAKRFIQVMLSRGTIRSAIADRHLTGISLEELLDETDEPDGAVAIPVTSICVTPQEPKHPEPNDREIKDCTVELEKLSREEAFYRFEQQILFSLMVWKNDREVRKKLPPVTCWIKGCVDTMREMIYFDDVGT